MSVSRSVSRRRLATFTYITFLFHSERRHLRGHVAMRMRGRDRTSDFYRTCVSCAANQGVGVKRPCPHSVGDGSNLGPSRALRRPTALGSHHLRFEGDDGRLDEPLPEKDSYGKDDKLGNGSSTRR